MSLVKVPCNGSCNTEYPSFGCGIPQCTKTVDKWNDEYDNIYHIADRIIHVVGKIRRRRRLAKSQFIYVPAASVGKVVAEMSTKRSFYEMPWVMTQLNPNLQRPDAVPMWMERVAHVARSRLTIGFGLVTFGPKIIFIRSDCSDYSNIEKYVFNHLPKHCRHNTVFVVLTKSHLR